MDAGFGNAIAGMMGRRLLILLIIAIFIGIGAGFLIGRM